MNIETMVSQYMDSLKEKFIDPDGVFIDQTVAFSTAEIVGLAVKDVAVPEELKKVGDTRSARLEIDDQWARLQQQLKNTKCRKRRVKPFRGHRFIVNGKEQNMWGVDLDRAALSEYRGAYQEAALSYQSWVADAGAAQVRNADDQKGAITSDYAELRRKIEHDRVSLMEERLRELEDKRE